MGVAVVGGGAFGTSVVRPLIGSMNLPGASQPGPGAGNGLSGAFSVAGIMKSRQIVFGIPAPNPAPGWSTSGLPCHTNETRSGVPPRNAELTSSSFVPVLPNASCPGMPLPAAVPLSMGPWRMLTSQWATSGSSTRVPGRPVSSKTTLPSGPTTLDTNTGSWWIPSPAMVEVMFAISSGVMEMTPSVKVRTRHSFTGWRPATLGTMPIFWAMSITLSRPTLVDMRTNAQFTESAVALSTVITPPPGSALNVCPSKPGTRHGSVPSTWSLREYPFWRIVPKVVTLKLDPTWRPAPSTARLNFDSL